MKYPNDTFYINSPQMGERSEQDELYMEEICHKRDLFVISGYIKPGKQTIKILDTYIEPNGKITE